MHLLAGTNGEWIVEGTTDKERVKRLLAAVFTYQLTILDGTMLFKKAKQVTFIKLQRLRKEA